jgi:hypothetical protein
MIYNDAYYTRELEFYCKNSDSELIILKLYIPAYDTELN